MSESDMTPSGVYRIKVSAGDDWRDFDCARLGISLGHHGTTGNKLFALLEWADQRFRHVAVDIYDAEHACNVGQERADAKALEWLSANSLILKTFKPEIVRTSQAEADMSFLPTDDPDFERAVRTDIDTAWHRKLLQYRGREGRLGTYEDFAGRSRQYVYLELAYMFSRDKRYIDVYPGDPLNSVIYLSRLYPDVGVLKVEYRPNGALEAALDAVERAA